MSERVAIVGVAQTKFSPKRADANVAELAYEAIEPVHPKEGPLIYGIIKLDGADTGMTHLIEGVPSETIHIGMRMRPVFAEDRKADILDIAYFTAA